MPPSYLNGTVSVSRNSTSGSPSTGFAVGSFSVIKGRIFFSTAAFSLVAFAKAAQSSTGVSAGTETTAFLVACHSSGFLNKLFGISRCGYTRRRSGRSTVIE